MEKDDSDSKRGKPLPPHGLLFPINSKDSFICTNPQDRIAHTMAFVAPVVEHWLEREIAQWVHSRIDPTTYCTMSERSYHGATSRSHIQCTFKDSIVTRNVTFDKRLVVSDDVGMLHLLLDDVHFTLDLAHTLLPLLGILTERWVMQVQL